MTDRTGDAIAGDPAETPSDPAGPARGPRRGSTVAVLLAAGAGSRFEGPSHKLLAPIAGGTVVQRSMGAALAALGPGLDRLVIVTGAVELPLGELVAATEDRVTVCHNERWAEGQATSLQTGLDAARALGASAIVVGLGDQPFVSPAAWRAVAAAAAPIAVATYDGRRGNPVRLGAAVWPLLPTEGDTGARAVMQVHPELVEEVPCDGSAVDIDTREDLERWI